MEKELSTLLRRITSKHHCDFCCLDCLHSFATKSKLKSYKKVCKNKGFCKIVMPSEKNNMKSDKMSYIIYAEIKFLIKKS